MASARLVLLEWVRIGRKSKSISKIIVYSRVEQWLHALPIFQWCVLATCFCGWKSRQSSIEWCRYALRTLYQCVISVLVQLASKNKSPCPRDYWKTLWGQHFGWVLVYKCINTWLFWKFFTYLFVFPDGDLVMNPGSLPSRQIISHYVIAAYDL